MGWGWVLEPMPSILALKAAGIGEGDEVITVSNSFIAQPCHLLTGAKPIFVDIDPETYTMDPNALEHLLKKRKTKERRGVKAVLPVHLYGHPAEMDAIMDIADRYNLIVIEDACQAHGAEYQGKKGGFLRPLGLFQFLSDEEPGWVWGWWNGDHG